MPWDNDVGDSFLWLLSYQGLQLPIVLEDEDAVIEPVIKSQSNRSVGRGGGAGETINLHRVNQPQEKD